jgi:hypothetical protein
MELHHVHPDKLLGDKGYDSDDIRSDLADCGIQPVIPPRFSVPGCIVVDAENAEAPKELYLAFVESPVI